MKRTTIILAALLGGLLGTASCDDGIDVLQTYGFRVTALPVQSSIRKDETAEIRCTLQRDGRWDGARYFLRYFQPEGSGELRTEERTVLTPNDSYPIGKEEFRLYYTSRTERMQQIDLYFSDGSGATQQLSFRFNNENSEE